MRAVEPVLELMDRQRIQEDRPDNASCREDSFKYSSVLHRVILVKRQAVQKYQEKTGSRGMRDEIESHKNSHNL